MLKNTVKRCGSLSAYATETKYKNGLLKTTRINLANKQVKNWILLTSPESSQICTIRSSSALSEYISELYFVWKAKNCRNHMNIQLHAVKSDIYTTTWEKCQN